VNTPTTKVCYYHGDLSKPAPAKVKGNNNINLAVQLKYIFIYRYTLFFTIQINLIVSWNLIVLKERDQFDMGHILESSIMTWKDIICFLQAVGNTFFIGK
jgi:hypothetical protein